ncbi:MAG: YceD family protein [Pseudomonadota bacterium]
MSESDLELLPIQFDPQMFADQHTDLHGLVATDTMQRLQSNIVSSEPMVTTKLRFSKGLFGYPLAMGEAHAKVTMRCERCLDNVVFDLDPHIEVLIKPAEEHLPNGTNSLEENPDFHEYEGNLLSLSELIEEELLLAMPLVPKHEDISLCNQDMVAWLASNEGPEADAKRAENPFAILKR